MPPVVSRPWKLASALFKGSWRRKAMAASIIVAALGATAVVLVTRNSPSRTTYSSQDGSYKVTVTHFPDGSKQEVREANVAGGAP